MMSVISKKSDTINESINNATAKNIKWSDISFIKEMNERLESLNDDKTKTYSWTEVQQEANLALETGKLNK